MFLREKSYSKDVFIEINYFKNRVIFVIFKKIVEKHSIHSKFIVDC